MSEPNSSSSPSSPPLPRMTLDGSECDSALAHSEFLTRQEVLSRRSRRLKKLAHVYKDHYWALMEELKGKYREYCWLYGRSPYKEDEKSGGGNCRGSTEGTGEYGKLGLALEATGDEFQKCAVAACKAKAMALTRFCHPHILSDSKQKLYKMCTYVIKRAQSGPILCGKPVLRSIVPSLCPTHFQMAEKQVSRALKKAGLNVSSPNKLAPKFHVIVAEYVNQIQTKRRSAQKATVAKIEIKEEKTS